MPVTSDDAFALANCFHDLSVAVHDYRMAQWDALTPGDRQTLEDREASLRNTSSSLVTTAVGLVLDETTATVAKIQGSIVAAQQAVKRLHDVRKVIDVATAGLGLAAAIASKDPGAIAKNVKGVYDAATAV